MWINLAVETFIRSHEWCDSRLSVVLFVICIYLAVLPPSVLEHVSQDICHPECLSKSHSCLLFMVLHHRNTITTLRNVSLCGWCLVIELQICCDVNSKGQHALVYRSRWKVTADEALSAWPLSVDFDGWKREMWCLLGYTLLNTGCCDRDSTEMI